MLFGEQVIKQHRAHTTQVQTTGGAWCKTYSNFFV